MSNVLPTQATDKVAKSKPSRISILGVVLTIILAVVIILLGERIMFDLNRTTNPIVESTVSSNTTNTVYKGMSLVSERSFNTRVYYPKNKTEDYRLYKVLIHAAFVLPMFLLMFLLYYWVNLKKRSENLRVVTWAYMIGAIWVLLHLIGETGSYVVDAYKNMAIYIILIFLAIILTSLAVFMQKKKGMS